jgi:dihydrofolate reductase
MRRVILSMSMSLDRYVASDRQHPGALPEDDELVKWRLDWMSGAAGAHLMGRTSYQQMAAFWPKSEHPYAAPMNDVPKIVFSKTQPVAVGSGQPLLGRLPAAQYLTLGEAKSFACGVVVHIYTPQQGPATGWAPAGAMAEGS